MRLTCPNCTAQYEVDDRVIPAAGRDVQCSNCGQAWFQPSAGAALAAASEPEDEGDLPFEDAAFAAPLPEAPAETDDVDDLLEPQDRVRPDLAANLDLSGGPELSPEAEAALVAALADTPGDALGARGTGGDWPPEEWPEDETSLTQRTTPTDSARASSATPPGEMPAAGLAAAGLAVAAFAPAGFPADPPASPPPPRPEGELRRRSVDEAVLSVLREEAEREARARRAHNPGLESQPELALTPAAPPGPRPASVPADTVPADATQRAATLRGADPELEAEIAAANRPPRRELLPDIEEINSTLRATSERSREAAAVDAPETLRRRRSGFRLGFGLSLGLAMILLGLYLGAPRLAAQLPAAAPALDGYVGAIDRGRLWLDQTVASRIDALSTAE